LNLEHALGEKGEEERAKHGKGVGAKDRVKEASMAAAEEGSKPQKHHNDS